MARYRIYNGPMPTTAVRAAVDTTALIKTILQVKPIVPARILGWGVSGDAAAVAAGVRWELLTTGLIAATVTAHVAAGIIPLDQAANDSTIAPSEFLTLGTAATGYTSSGEGVVVATKTFDSVFVTPTDVYIRKFDQPIIIPTTDYLRIRCKAAVAINAVCWVDIEV